MSSDYARAFADAVFREVRAEMARQGIDGVRAMARLIGTENHTSINDRLSLTRARRKPIDAEDLATYCSVLGIDPGEIVSRADAAVLTKAQQAGDDIVERARTDARRRAAEAAGTSGTAGAKGRDRSSGGRVTRDSTGS